MINVGDKVRIVTQGVFTSQHLFKKGEEGEVIGIEKLDEDHELFYRVEVKSSFIFGKDLDQLLSTKDFEVIEEGER